PRAAHAARGHGRVGRGRARRARHPRLDDRNGAAARARRGPDPVNGGHDLGGMMGFGPVASEPDEATFHADWERRAFGLAMAMQTTGAFTLDAARHARERLHPVEYLGATYYEMWTTAL